MTSMALRWILIGALLMAAPVAHGENGCPAGFLPTGGMPSAQNPGACRPMQSYEYPQAQPDPPLPPPRPVPPLEWKPDWGALAVDAQLGTIGSAVEAPTQDQAEDVALKDCQSKGGAACRLKASYENGCVALAASDAGWAVEIGDTEIEAEVKAIRTCTTGGHKRCRVLHKDCSRPNGFSSQ
ncbi:MAG: DUF4189 domain-containing protein [Rhodanobacter sp.]